MLRDLIATPGEATVGRLAKQYRIDPDVHALLISEIDKAVAAEREACARIADRMAIENKQGVKNAAADHFTSKMIINECAAIASAIRARSNNSN